MTSIPFTRPYITGEEITFIREVIDSGNIAADGRFTQQVSQLLCELSGAEKVLMTPSGTAALEIAVLLCDLNPGDEVILPSFTFVSSANAIVRSNGKPVFVDIRPDTLNIDERLIEASITERTRAIMPVHYAGTACDMGRIMQIAERYDLKVIEDAAQAVNSFYDGEGLGSIGHFGAFSFHHTKNYQCGEGGALCINDSSFFDRAEVVREKGTNRSQFLRGQIDKFTWVALGSSYLPPEISSAFLYAQLQKLDWITQRHREIYERYREGLQPLADSGLLGIPTVPEACTTNYHFFYILLPNLVLRDSLMSFLSDNGIQAVFHYVPLHSSPMGKTFGYMADDLPITENLSGRLLRLPTYPDLTEAEQRNIIELVNYYLNDVEARDLIKV